MEKNGNSSSNNDCVSSITFQETFQHHGKYAILNIEDIPTRMAMKVWMDLKMLCKGCENADKGVRWDGDDALQVYQCPTYTHAETCYRK